MTELFKRPLTADCPGGDPRGWRVIYVCRPDFPEDRYEGPLLSGLPEGYARIFAAAPALLEACKLVQSVDAYLGGKLPPRVAQHVADMIKLAEGGAP